MKVAFGVLIALMLSVTMVTACDIETADAAEPPISSISFDSDAGGLIIEAPVEDGIRAIVSMSGQGSVSGSGLFTDGTAVVSFSDISEGNYSLSVRIQGYDDRYTGSIEICELIITSGSQQHSVLLSTGEYTLKDYSDYGFQAPEGKEFGGWTFDGVNYQPGSTIQIEPDNGSYTLRIQAVWNDSGEPTQTAVSFVADGNGSFEITPEGPVTVNVGTSIIANGDTLTIGDYTITAKAGENYEFSRWEYSGTSVTENMTITAVFTETTGTTYYDVTVNQVTGGTAAANPARAEAGTTVDLSVDLDEGYVLTGWKVISGDITIANNSFVMPASDVTVEPVIEEITIPVTGVTVSGAETAIEGTTVQYTATVLPEDATHGDIVWSVDDESVATVDQNGKVRFLTPGPVTITATAGGVSGSITVEVFERSPESISAVVGVYDKGDTFNWDDVTVTVHYNNGQSETITDGFTVDLADGALLDTPGTIETTVHYDSMECTLEVTVRAPGQVAITVNVVGGGLFGGAVLYWDDESRTITTYGTILVDEGTQVTLSCDGLFAPTVTVDGQVVDSDYTFLAVKDMTFMVVFPTDDDDDDDPVNPSTPVQDGDDDSTTYIVAIAAAAVVAILAALILMQTRKS